MYRLLYDDAIIFDPYGESNEVVTDAKMSIEINAPAYLDFVMGPEHPLYNTIQERDGIVTLYSDNDILFEGVIDSISDDFHQYKSISCVSALDYINDVVTRPYSTSGGTGLLTAPDTIDKYFEWLINMNNEYTMSPTKQFEVGVNQGSNLSATNRIFAESSGGTTIGSEITSKILDTFGGYLVLRYERGRKILDLYSDVHEMNAQLIDFGVNLLDFTRSRDTADQYTALRPTGGTPEGSDQKPITLSSIDDGPTSFNVDVAKKGDVIYSISGVQRYGYKEGTWSTDDTTDPLELLEMAIPQLVKQSSPIISIDVKAVDLALYTEGYEHLKIGQAVRIRSKPHHIDEYLMVSSISLDLQDPGQSEYMLGASYDTLTGQQSTYLRTLNSGINSSLDKVEALDQVDKEQAIAIGNAQQAADDAQQSADNAQNAADNAQNAADNAQNTANNAQNTANSNKEEIDSIKDAQTEYDKQLEQAEQEIGQVNERIEGMNSEIESAKSDIDSLRSSTETEFQNVKQSVSKVQSDVESVSQKAEDLASDLDGTKATVEQVTTDLGEVKTTVSNAATKADQALQVSTSASQTATEARTTATSAYQDAQSALTQSSVASQTANAVKTELETKYSTTDEIAEQYATKSLVEQTSQSITSTVEATYATKATVEALENIANNAVQTWMGSGVPTLSNKPASDWTTAELKSQHSGDIYYDTDTGYSYRFGSSDGRNYSWSLIKDTDISKAVADAAKAQQTAEGVSDEVTQLKTDIPATYATKTEVKQTTDSIKSTVSEVATTANSALSKATTVEQTANGLQTTVTEQAKKLDGAVTTISQVSQKVDSVSSTITQVQGDIDRIDANSQNFITNPQFKSGNADGVLNTNMNATDSNPGVLPGTATTFGKNSSGYDNRAENVKIKFIKNHTYRIEIDARLASDNAYTGTEGLGLFFWFMTADNPGLSESQYTGHNANLIPHGTKEWTHASYDYTPTMGDGDPRIIFRPAYRVAPSSRWLVTNFTCTDVTAIAEAQKDADTANSTANSAMSQASRVEQSLDSFKTSVSQTYETKNDALNKQSSLQQSVNNLRTEVSETYTTKTEFDNLQIGGTNLIRGSANGGDDYSPGNGSMQNDGYLGNGAVHTTGAWTGYVIRALDISKRVGFTNGITLTASIYVSTDSETEVTHNLRLYRATKNGVENKQWNNVKLKAGVWTRLVATYSVPDVSVMVNSMRFECSVGTSYDILWSSPKLEIGTKPTAWSPAPEDMLSNAEAAQTYSTKSYVDQTSRTVSLGVVEEYKNGQHGSALATQSDITATKDSITQTVSQTYATKTELNNLQVGGTNLLPNTGSSKGYGTSAGQSNLTVGTDDIRGEYYRRSTTGTSEVFISSNRTTGIDDGEYTVSFWYRVNQYVKNVDVFWLARSVESSADFDTSGAKTVVSGLNPQDNTWTYWSGTFTAISGKPNGYIRINNNGSSTNGQTATLDVTQLKLERGTKPTDWSPAPEDIDENFADLADIVNANNANTASLIQSSIEQTKDSIISQVSASYYTKTEAEELMTQMSTQFQQTENSFEMQFNSLRAIVDQVNESADTNYSNIQKYIRFVDGHIVIGVEGNPFSLDIGNDRISFMQNNSEIAYISNHEFYITSGIITQNLRIGNFEFRPRSNGNLSLSLAVI